LSENTKRRDKLKGISMDGRKRTSAIKQSESLILKWFLIDSRESCAHGSSALRMGSDGLL
jgi:hypothetical protein